MRWGRGFFRLWVVAIPVWVIWVMAWTDRVNSEFRERHPRSEILPYGTDDAIGLMIAGPVAAFAGYVAIRWVTRGFRQ